MHDTVELSPEVTWQDVAGEIVILDPASLRYFTLSESAVSLWRALANGSSRSSLAALLTDEYGLDIGAAQADVDAFLEQLRERGLVTDGAERHGAS